MSVRGTGPAAAAVGAGEGTGMYISLNGTLTRGGQLSWPAFAGLAGALDYGGVDVNLGAAMRAGVDFTKRFLAALKLEPAVVGLPVNFRGDDATFQEGLANLDESARFAAQIGCPRMGTWIMSSSDTPKGELRRTYRDRFKACSEILARHNVRLALEFLGPLHIRKRGAHEFIWRMSEMLELARDAGPNVGLLLDSWHWHHAEGTTREIVEAGKERIVHVQVADSQDLPPEEIRDGERLLPGEGVVDLKGFYQALKKIGYEDGLSPEVFGRGLKDMKPEHGARLGLETMKQTLEAAGIPIG